MTQREQPSHRIQRAVIMAAGEGRRLRPVTLQTPKPLIPVNGVRMIDTVIRGLRENGIAEIYVVIGYLKECYENLPREYPGLTLLENPYFSTCNNISSAFVAREFLQDAFLTEADFIVQNPALFRPEFAQSAYCAIPTRTAEEWSLTLNEAGRIIGCDPSGKVGSHQLMGVSLWTAEDGKRLSDQLEDVFIHEKVRDIYWDELALFRKPDAYSLGIREIQRTDLFEIDTLEDLAATDAAYASYLTR